MPARLASLSIPSVSSTVNRIGATVGSDSVIHFAASIPLYWHGQIKYPNVGLEFFEFPDTRPTALSLATNEPVVRMYDGTENAPCGLGVIHDQNSQRQWTHLSTTACGDGSKHAKAEARQRKQPDISSGRMS
jgi:hypothetical protein